MDTDNIKRESYESFNLWRSKIDNMKLPLKNGDAFKVRTDTGVMYLAVAGIGYDNNGDVHDFQLQATDVDGKVHVVEVSRVRELPEGWKKSTWAISGRGYI